MVGDAVLCCLYVQFVWPCSVCNENLAPPLSRAAHIITTAITRTNQNNCLRTKAAHQHILNYAGTSAPVTLPLERRDRITQHYSYDVPLVSLSAK
jgi:hypothetical protein